MITLEAWLLRFCGAFFKVSTNEPRFIWYNSNTFGKLERFTFLLATKFLAVGILVQFFDCENSTEFSNSTKISSSGFFIFLVLRSRK